MSLKVHSGNAGTVAGMPGAIAGDETKPRGLGETSG